MSSANLLCPATRTSVTTSVRDRGCDCFPDLRQYSVYSLQQRTGSLTHWGTARMNPKKRQRISIRTDRTTAIVSLGAIEIWDGADLALLREVLSELIEQESFLSIGVDLTSVKYIPSGFFGMLFEWYEDGVEILLVSPQPNVEQMLWFRMFFLPDSDGRYILSDEAIRHHTPNQQVEYHRRQFTSDDSSGGDDVDSIRFGMSTSG